MRVTLLVHVTKRITEGIFYLFLAHIVLGVVSPNALRFLLDRYAEIIKILSDFVRQAFPWLPRLVT